MKIVLNKYVVLFLLLALMKIASLESGAHDPKQGMNIELYINTVYIKEALSGLSPIIKEVPMCGRLDVIDDLLANWVLDTLGVSFTTKSNTDLHPRQSVDVIATIEGDYRQMSTNWGIQPRWARKLLINAMGETAAEKKTFRSAFHARRCVVPCTGWYEWRDEGGTKKQKYSFTHTDSIPFLMGGILFENELGTELVTLTTSPNEKCEEFHHRTPVLIHHNEFDRWMNGTTEEIMPLIEPIDGEVISISKM